MTEKCSQLKMVFVRKKLLPAVLAISLCLFGLVSPMLLDGDDNATIVIDKDVGMEDVVDVEFSKTKELVVADNNASNVVLGETVTGIDFNTLQENVENSTVGVNLDYPDGSTSNGTLLLVQNTTQHSLLLETESLSIVGVENGTEVWKDDQHANISAELKIPDMNVSNHVECSDLDPNCDLSNVTRIDAVVSNTSEQIESNNTSSNKTDYSIYMYRLDRSNITDITLDYIVPVSYEISTEANPLNSSHSENESHITNLKLDDAVPYTLHKEAYSLDSNLSTMNTSSRSLLIQPRMARVFPVEATSEQGPSGNSSSKFVVPSEWQRSLPLPSNLPTDLTTNKPPWNESTNQDITATTMKRLPFNRAWLRGVAVPASIPVDVPTESTTPPPAVFLSLPVVQTRVKKTRELMPPELTTIKPTQGTKKSSKRFRSVGVATKSKKQLKTKPAKKTGAKPLLLKSGGVFRSIGSRKNGTRKITGSKKNTTKAVLKKRHRTTKLFRKGSNTDTDWKMKKIFTEYL